MGMDFEEFMAAARYSQTTMEMYRRYASQLTQLGEIDQEKIDAAISQRPAAVFRSFLRTYLYQFLRRNDIMMFVRTFIFFLGVLATVFLGWAALVGVPDAMISEVKPPPRLQRYTDEQLLFLFKNDCFYFLVIH